MTIREDIDEVLWRERTPAEIIQAMGDTFKDSLPLHTHILLHQATKLLQSQADLIEAMQQETAAEIVNRVRQNCTLDWDIMQKGGDGVIYAVADWIENPPEWVTAPWRKVTGEKPVEETQGSQS